MNKSFLYKNLFTFAVILGIAAFWPKQAQAVLCAGFQNTSVTLTNTTCVIDNVMGIDDPNNIETSTANGAALTLGNNVANPGQPVFITINPGAALSTGVLSVKNDVTISIAEGGQILSGRPLYMEDKDADGWPANGNLFTSTLSGSRRRLGLMRSRTVFDCSDNPNGGYNPTNSWGPWYRDADGDTFGRSDVTTTQDCTPPAGYVANSTDCNDGSSLVWISGSQCYNDVDGDGWTSGLNATSACRNNASCNSATRASNTAHGATVGTYTAGRLKTTATAADCNDASYSAGNTCFMAATGGNITTSGNYKIHTFNSSGTFTVTQLGANNNVEYLIVAGGGGGGYGAGGGAGRGGGGGGAGGLIVGTVPVNQQAYGITVGGGGAAGTNCGYGGSGGYSDVAGLSAVGGGGGGGCQGYGGVGGGSGGGSAGNNALCTGGGGGTAGQGYAGGSVCTGGVARSGAGGGGRGGGGASAPQRTAGVGLAWSITGASVVYATGGTGSSWGSSESCAGQGPVVTPNLGNGGDGGYSTTGCAANGRAGGSGVVILKYLYQ